MKKMTKNAAAARKARNARFARVFAATKPGSLHKALGVAADKPIPTAKLKKAAKTLPDKDLRAKAAIALNAQSAAKKAAAKNNNGWDDPAIRAKRVAAIKAALAARRAA